MFVLCVCVGVHAQRVCLWSSEDDVQELVLSSHWRVPGTGLGLSSGSVAVLSHDGALRALSDVRMLDVRLVWILTPGNATQGFRLSLH